MAKQNKTVVAKTQLVTRMLTENIIAIGFPAGSF